MALLIGSPPGPVSGVLLAPAAAAGLPVTLELTEVTPAAVTPDGTVIVSGRVRNTADRRLRRPQVRLLLHRDRLGTREEVSAWPEVGLDHAVPIVESATNLRGDLRPGDTKTFTIRLPARRLGLSDDPQAFGPYGIGVEALAGAREPRRVGVIDSTVVWSPTTTFRPTRFTMLVPITHPVTRIEAGRPTGELAASVAPGGRLARLLAATTDPAMAWALDPAVAVAVRRITEAEPGQPLPAESAGSAEVTASPSPGSDAVAPGSAAAVADADARAWLAVLGARAQGRAVIQLPFADLDLAAMGQARARDLVEGADRLGARGLGPVLGREPDLTVAVPFDGTADRRTLAMLATTGRTAVVVAEDALPAASGLGYTPDAVAGIRAGGRKKDGDLTALVADERLSARVAGAGGPNSTAAIQRLLADLAAVTLERPVQSRHLLATTPRDWDPDPAAVRQAVAALRAAPWVELAGLDDLRDVPPATGTGRPAAPRAPGRVRAAALPVEHVAQARDAWQRLTRFAPALQEPEVVLPPLREGTLSLLSVTWRDRQEEAARAGSELAEEVATFAGGVRVVGDGPYNLLTSAGDLPIRVENSLEYAVRVELRLRPRSARLTATERALVELSPRSGRDVRIPVRGVANGDVDVEAVLRAPGGTVVGVPTTFTVRVRQDWESRGVIAAGILLVGLLLFGLSRSVRGGRRRLPPEAAPDVDDVPTGQLRRVPVPGHSAQQPAHPPMRPGVRR
jgi:hypothetical protein